MFASNYSKAKRFHRDGFEGGPCWPGPKAPQNHYCLVFKLQLGASTSRLCMLVGQSVGWSKKNVKSCRKCQEMSKKLSKSWQGNVSQ